MVVDLMTGSSISGQKLCQKVVNSCIIVHFLSCVVGKGGSVPDMKSFYFFLKKVAFVQEENDRRLDKVGVVADIIE